MKNEDWDLVKYDDSGSPDIAIELNEKQLEAIKLILGLEILSEEERYSIISKYDQTTLTHLIKKLREWIDTND